MELQDLRPEVRLSIDRVGFKGVWRRASIRTPSGELLLDMVIDVFVDVVPDRRGIHLSRSIEAIKEALATIRSAWSIEAYLDKIAKKLLEKHDYAMKARVVASTKYLVSIEYAGIRGEEPVDVTVSVERDREGKSLWSVTTAVKGMTACPSAQATILELERVEPRRLVPTHSQRTIVKGTVTTRGYLVRIEDLARALANSLSAPAFTLLKRPDEAKLIVEAHKNPLLIEDVVRRAFVNIIKVLEGKAPGDTVIEVEAVSLESIHPHEVYAYKRSRLADAVAEIGGQVS